ncbi:hypothetical protein KKZ84_08185 [Enterobacter hormaechei subsp. xiangfangensis]|uniref:hypothetical protein n=1 Tax=Enterobacter hormaechei TaxID=158836 RepID=UPI0013960A30|nr:hypothetical protein [Enterobacter hormaechei]MBT1843647.1 hypothetical protein [Enterobacter hormaechei subsp. xiangfangensis]
MRHTTTRLIAVVAGMAQTGLSKAGLPEKGRRKITLSVCFFTVYYSPLFTLNKNISNTVF